MCALDVRPAIGTERLIVRGATRADAPAVAELANDLGVAGNLLTMPYPYRPADAEAHLAKAERADPRVSAEFAIEHREFGVIGMLGFHEKAPRRAEVGYWLGRPFWNRSRRRCAG
jgi:RimJ/RimL family protein N-acetyltransferase